MERRPANHRPSYFESVQITGLLGEYQPFNPLNSRGSWGKMKRAEGSGDDSQECMKERCTEVFTAPQKWD